MAKTTKEELLELAVEQFGPKITKDKDLVIRILAGTIIELTKRVVELTGEAEGPVGGEAIIQATRVRLDRDKVEAAFPFEKNWDETTKDAFCDLVIHATAVAVCSYVKEIV